MGSTKILAAQFVRGILCKEVIFSFIKQAIDKLTFWIDDSRMKITIVIDNSPLNHSTAIYNYAIMKGIGLLFTAPNSSFLNPIEMLFGKLKAPLKKRFCLNK